MGFTVFLAHDNHMIKTATTHDVRARCLHICHIATGKVPHVSLMGFMVFLAHDNHMIKTATSHNVSTRRLHTSRCNWQCSAPCSGVSDGADRVLSLAEGVPLSEPASPSGRLSQKLVGRERRGEGKRGGGKEGKGWKGGGRERGESVEGRGEGKRGMVGREGGIDQERGELGREREGRERGEEKKGGCGLTQEVAMHGHMA